ncbi:hypothetical protein, partial [Winogradskyella sp.]|uniref:hypothetical protein n=1 Tax=Winogradskyella sp. TaxID=1883156 RepID=UPI0025E5A99B
LIFLMISNGYFLVHYMSKRGHRDHDYKFSIAKKLNFDEKQMAAYDSMKTAHFDNMKSLFKKNMGLKKAMYSKVSDENVTQSYLDSIGDLIAKGEKEKDIEMFKHFKKVRALCNDKQKEQLTKIINDAIKRRSMRRKHKKRD